MLSIFDIFKIGVGPSSSHTNGPMIAGYQFSQIIADLTQVARVQIDLYGSLSLTGRGHHTDRAVILGLLGNKPETIKITSANQALAHAIEHGELNLAGKQLIPFQLKTDLLFQNTNLPLHENGMTITAFGAQGQILAFETYYSVGGGFVATAKELEHGSANAPVEVEFPFTSADELLFKAEKHGLSLGSLVLRNEIAFHDLETINHKADQIWKVIRSACSAALKRKAFSKVGCMSRAARQHCSKNWKLTRRLKTIQWRSWTGLTCLLSRSVKKMQREDKWSPRQPMARQVSSLQY
jgi:L-serine dehydratase